MTERDAPIGVFDSGMGGLTVLAALRIALPQENFIYLGDTARLPYGTKSAATIKRYASRAARVLTARGVKAVVVACNTASGLALDFLANEITPIPAYGVVAPGAEAAAVGADETGVLVLATESTVKGGAYQRALLARDKALRIFAHACPLWVTLAEMGVQDEAFTQGVLGFDISPNCPTTVLLGCTHFPVFRSQLEKLYGQIRFIDSAETTAAWVARDLLVRDLLARDLLTREMGSVRGERQIEFLATDGIARFARVGRHFLGEEIGPVELIDL